MRTIIYYFTGTGNSLRGAQKIGEYLGNTEIISMRCRPEMVPAVDADRIGFIFPVHHWTMPGYAIDFVKKVGLNNKAYIFAVSMPGLINGSCMSKLDEVLKEKGCSLSYGAKVYSVANYVAMYPPFPNPEKRVPKTERVLEVIAEEIGQNKLKPYPRANALTKLMSPRMKKFIEHCPSNDKYFSVWNDCISCGLCAKVCPCHNIEFADGKPVFKHQCSQCMACVAMCPKEAINFPKNTRERKKYHNPHVTAADIASDRKYYR